MSKHWPGLLLLAVWIGGAGSARADVTAPTPLDIGSVVVGQSSTADETLSSAVATPNVSVTLATTGDCGMFSITGPAFPITVGPGAGNDKKVTFKFMPTSTGDHTCLATVIGAPNNPTFTVKGKGIAPQISVVDPTSSPAQLQFNHVDVGQMSALPVTIKNVGDAPLTITTAGFTSGMGDYLMSGGPAGAIAVNDQATYTITCKPSTSGARDGVFEITSDSFTLKTVPVVLKCVGDQGVIMLGSSTLDFGRVFRGTTATKTFTLSNPGNVTVNNVVGAPAPSTAGYSIDLLTPIPGTLNPNDPKQITVKFSPQNTMHGGPATLALTGTWGTSMTAAAPLPIAITGLYASFSLPDAPATLEFGMFRFDAHQPKTFQILNDGNAALLISAPFSPDQGTADNEYQLEFIKGSLVVATPQVPLAAGERVDVIVTPHVVNRIGPVSGALEVTSDAGGSHKVTLNGAATSAKVKIPSSVEFGLVDVNGPPLMKTVTIENTGDGTLDIRSIGAISATPGGVPNPAFTIMAPSALPQLPPNGKLDIPVIYRPTVASDADAGDAVILSAQLEGSLSATATVMISGNAVFTEAHGGGGCSAGRGTAGGATGGALLIGVAAAVALGRRRRRLTGLAAPAAAVMLALAPAARADDIGIAVFEPTPATMSAGFALQAPDVGPSGSWVMNAVASYASHPLVLISLDDGGDQVATTTRVERSTLMQIGAAYALFDRLELGAHLPLYQQSGETNKQDTSQQAVTGTALGNLAVHAKARLVQLGGAAGTFVAGASAAVVLPTATSGQFTGSDRPEGRALVLGSFTPSALSSRLALSINAGPVVRAKSEFANVVEGSGAAWGAGAAIRISDELWATGELFGEVTPSGLRRQGMNGAPGKLDTLVQVEWLAGLTVRPDRRFSLGLAVGRGVTDAVGTPELRGVLALSVVPGAAAVAPVHPPEPVKIDGDADGDGIRDSVDKCPNEPEDKDMFEDDDGCPDPDNDHDGIPDALDKCPLDPEDKDGFQDDDGCPDKDNDGDGVPDTLDKCPNEPEDKDGFQDLDGCPDPDNDGDGIPDALDKCPNEPETINGFQDDDGCPDKGDSSIILSADRIETLDPIQFTGVKLARGAAPLLGQIAATLRAHAEIIRVRVTVHVQPSNDPDADQARSDKRAQAIRDWLVQWGIAATRLDARGFGGSKPLVPPDQRGAAKINDRLELIILERK